MKNRKYPKKENAFFKAIKAFKWGYILLALLAIALGACLIIFNGESLNTAAIAVGVVIIIASIAYAAVAIKNKKRGASFFLKIAFSVILLISGIASIIAKDGAIESIIATVGLIIIMDGSFKFNTTAMAWRNRVLMWWVLLAVSVILIICGFVTIRYLRADTENIAVWLGVFLVLDGVANIFSPFMLGSIERRDEKALREKIAHELEGSHSSANTAANSTESVSPDDTSLDGSEADSVGQENPTADSE